MTTLVLVREASAVAVLALISDLMLGSQLTGAAARCGVTVELVRSVDTLLAAASQAAPRLVIVDLREPGLDLGELVSRLRAVAPGCSCLAFGPHVHKPRLEAARAAGFEHVMSQGQFHAEMDSVLRSQQ